jgi:hypothetical protein
MRVHVSTGARHSAATAVIVEPTPQIALSAAAAIELVYHFHAVRSSSLHFVALGF